MGMMGIMKRVLRTVALATASLCSAPALAQSPGVTVSESTLSLNEGSAGTYTLVLNTVPSATTTVTATSDNPSVTVDSDATSQTQALTFTTSDWNSAQTVTVTATQDGDSGDESVTISHAVTGYGSVATTTSVAVTVTDDDAPSLSLVSVALGTDPPSPDRRGGTIVTWWVNGLDNEMRSATGDSYLLATTAPQVVRFEGIGSNEEDRHVFCREKNIGNSEFRLFGFPAIPNYIPRSSCRRVGESRSSMTVELSQEEIDFGGVVWHATQSHSYSGSYSVSGHWVPIVAAADVADVALSPPFNTAQTNYSGLIAGNALQITPVFDPDTVAVSVNNATSTTVASGLSYAAYNLNTADRAINTVAVEVVGSGVATSTYMLRLEYRAAGLLSFASGVSGKSFTVGRPIALFQVPATVGGEGTVRYSARGLPAGLWFDADGRGRCGLPRSVCGTPSEAGSWTVSVTARDGAGGDAALTFSVDVVAEGDAEAEPPAAVPDAALREATARALGVEASSLTEADLLALSSLSAAWSGVTNLAGLSAASNLRRLELGGNAVADLSELSGLRLLEHLDLSDNAVSDLSELSGLTRLETLLLSGNRVSDLSPLRGMAGLRSLFLDGNAVSDLTPVVFLESLEELSLSGNPLGGLSPLCALRKLKRLWLAASGLSDLSELSCLTGLERLWLADNAVEDVGPLRGMRALEWLDLERNAVAGVAPLRRLNALTRLRLGSNRVSDAGPLAANDGLAAGDVAGLRGNPLSEASIQRHVPALRERGVAVLAGLPSPWFAASGDASGRRSFMRLINRSDVAGEALVWGVDDAGERFGPARLSIGAGRTAHFNSEDLEFGNAAKGLADGLGAPTAGDWRLEVLSTLDLEAQTFLRASGGPPSALHDGLPRVGGTLRAAFLPAGRERSPAGALRVSNPTGSDATAYAWGVDEAGVGRLATGLVAPAGRAVTVTASELERWRMGSGRGLGRGAGNWRLELTAPWPLAAQALAVGDGGRTGNLSGPAVALGPGVVARVPLFPPASAAGRVGVARVWNLGAAAGEVLVTAVDDAGVSAGPVVLALEAFETAEFDSRELEEGGGPLAEGVGAPTRGSWRLELRAQFGARVHARAVGAGGYATGLLEAAPRSGGAARVSVFNPGSNRAQRGLLRLANDGAEDAAATIEGVDDAGRAGGAVSVTVPAGEALWLSAAELESGDAGFEGSLGDGEGKWRLTVSSAAPLTVMSLVEDERGAIGNLSTPGRR